jgi:hypothetical protein
MPAHPALRPMAPLLAVAEVVLLVLVGLFEAVDVVKEGVDVGLDV